MSHETQTTYPSLDGLTLAGTLIRPTEVSQEWPAVLMIHGITADRDEGGLFRDIANRLAERSVPSLRFDLRAHGQSNGRMEELTLHGCVSDIVASGMILKQRIKTGRQLAVIGASFGGGLAVLHAARHLVERLTLLNPNLDFCESWFRGTDKWDDGCLSSSAIAHLRDHGWLPRGEFRMGAAFVNEAIHVRPASVMPTIVAPALTIHGTADTMTSFRTAQESHRTDAYEEFSQFIAINGAEHGFIVPGDELLLDPHTHEYREEMIAATLDWLSSHRLRRRRPPHS